jgi:hypothetical protein
VQNRLVLFRTKKKSFRTFFSDKVRTKKGGFGQSFGQALRPSLLVTGKSCPMCPPEYPLCAHKMPARHPQSTQETNCWVHCSFAHPCAHRANPWVLCSTQLLGAFPVGCFDGHKIFIFSFALYFIFIYLFYLSFTQLI